MSVISILEILGVFLNFVTWLTLDLALYMCVIFLSLMMSLFTCFKSSEIIWGIGTGVSAFIFQNIILGIFSIFGLSIKSWLLTG